MENSICIFIISHGRPNDVITWKTLQDANVKLPIFIVIDNEDKTQDQYHRKYPGKVYVFDKIKYASLVDNYDNLENRRSTTHARNACFDIADDLGFRHFLVLDDDYPLLSMRINGKMEHPQGHYKILKGLDEIILKTFEYYRSTGFTSICFSQGGDWFGGDKNFGLPPKRKAMNSFFCSLDRRFWFESRLNEDVNTYMILGHRGHVFLTIPFVQVDQKQTQATAGGMTDAYLSGGTYTKSFYTVLTRPDCTTINLMGRSSRRLHHSIKWDNAVPKIIPETYKK